MSTATAQLPQGFDSRRLLARLLVLAAVIAAVAAVLMLVPGLVAVRERLAHAQAGWLVAAAGFELLSLAAYVVAFRAAFCARMGWAMSYRIGMSELGATALLPVGGIGGLAFGVWALRRGGMPEDLVARRTVAFFLITSAVNIVAVVGAGLGLALGLLAGTDRFLLSLGPVAVAAAAVAVVLVLPHAAGRIPARWSDGDAARPLRAIAKAAAIIGDGVGDAVALLRSGNGRLIGGAVGYLAFDLAVFFFCFRAFGDTPPIAHLMLAYLVGQLGALIPLPGGIGGTDVGLVGALVIYGTPAAMATVGVLAYRAILLAIPAILGGHAFVALRRTLRDDEDEAFRVPCADDPRAKAAP